jgi:isopentenyl diphosphate isomerase/L-lactate dehydrogenase-like FMN-dependent dehydrogenase
MMLLLEELKIVMFCTGHATLESLKQSDSLRAY